MPELLTPLCLAVGLEWRCAQGSLGLTVPFPTDPCHGWRSEQGQGFTAGLAQELRAWPYHNPCPLEFTSLRKTPYTGASAVSSSHLCTVQAAVLPQFPSSVKHQLGLTEAAFPRAARMLLGVILKRTKGSEHK